MLEAQTQGLGEGGGHAGRAGRQETHKLRAFEAETAGALRVAAFAAVAAAHAGLGVELGAAGAQSAGFAEHAPAEGAAEERGEVQRQLVEGEEAHDEGRVGVGCQLGVAAEVRERERGRAAAQQQDPGENALVVPYR